MGTCGTVLRGVRTAAHRGIGPGFWPTEVGAARAGCALCGAPAGCQRYGLPRRRRRREAGKQVMSQS